MDSQPLPARTYLRFGLAMLCLYVVLYGITQWIQAVRGLSETAVGLTPDQKWRAMPR